MNDKTYETIQMALFIIGALVALFFISKCCTDDEKATIELEKVRIEHNLEK